jgi:hypothetical protein
MPRPQPGKKYLIVFCRSCNKGFRVVDSALDPGKQTRLPTVAVSLKCRGCGHTDSYAPNEMRVAQLGPKPARNRT